MGKDKKDTKKKKVTLAKTASSDKKKLAKSSGDKTAKKVLKKPVTKSEVASKKKTAVKAGGKLEKAHKATKVVKGAKPTAKVAAKSVAKVEDKSSKETSKKKVIKDSVKEVKTAKKEESKKKPVVEEKIEKPKEDKKRKKSDIDEADLAAQAETEDIPVGVEGEDHWDKELERPAEVVPTNEDGLPYCRVKECDQVATVEAYCRFHYLLHWKRIQTRRKILADGKLLRYVEELTARYPDKYLEMIYRDLKTEKDFVGAIQEMEIDESNVDNEFEDEQQTLIDEVRGIGGEAPAAADDEEF